MQFTTSMFLFIFFPLSIMGYYVVNMLKKIKINNWYLVCISFAFYAWAGVTNAMYLLIFVFLVYVFGNLIQYARQLQESSNKWLVTSVAGVLVILFYCKYVNFFIQNVNNIFKSEISLRTVVVPLGLSFLIFESISYFVDIFRGGGSASR